MAIRILLLLLLLTGGVCQAQSIALQRDGKNLYPPFALSTDQVQAGIDARAALDLLRDKIQKTDTLVCTGTVDFGSTQTLVLPECNYLGPARWLTHCMIDSVSVNGVETKPIATCGFSLQKYARFENFYLGGDCSNKNEDGGLIGWAGSFKPAGEVEFVNCEVDASKGMDWGIYTWENTSRKVTMKGGTLRFCRFGLALAGGGAGANQQSLFDSVKLIGDANGSTSFGDSSLYDPNNPKVTPDMWAVLTPVLNKQGASVIRNCDASATGLAKEYNSKYGCPRIAALCTNQYYSKPGAPVEFTLDRNRVTIIQGTVKQWSDYDVRGVDTGKAKVSVTYDDAAIASAKSAGDKLLAAAKGGSNQDGSMKVWTP